MIRTASVLDEDAALNLMPTLRAHSSSSTYGTDKMLLVLTTGTSTSLLMPETWLPREC